MPRMTILHLKDSDKEAGTAAFWRVLITVWDKVIEGLHLISSDSGSWPKSKFTLWLFSFSTQMWEPCFQNTSASSLRAFECELEFCRVQFIIICFCTGTKLVISFLSLFFFFFRWLSYSLLAVALLVFSYHLLKAMFIEINYRNLIILQPNLGVTNMCLTTLCCYNMALWVIVAFLKTSSLIIQEEEDFSL